MRRSGSTPAASVDEVIHLRLEAARFHPVYFLPHVVCPDSRSGGVFNFATLTREEARVLQMPFHGETHRPRGTPRGETSWMWQRDYVEWVLDNKFGSTLKARQLGISWIHDGLILHDLIFAAGIDDAVYSVKEEDAVEQINRIWDMWLSLPDYMKVGLKVLKPWGANSRPSSRIEIEHADGRVSTVTGMVSTKKSGHGRVFKRVLFDEGAHQDYAREIWKAIIPAVGDTGGTAHAVSTANGISDGSGGGNFFHELYTGAGGVDYPGVARTFLPWYMHPDRTQEWYDGLNMDASSKAEQYPEDDDEAFLLTGQPFFDLVGLQHYSRDLAAEPLFKFDFKTFGNNYAAARIVKSSDGMIECYRRPQPNAKYVLAADTATGAGKDYSVGAVLDLSDGAPCAELRMKADYVDFTRQLHFLGKWYNTAIIAPEKGGGYGDVVIAYLRDGHEGRQPYPKVYRHRNYDDPKGKEKAQLGFPMNDKTRGMVVSQLGEWVSQTMFPWLTKRFRTEARTFVRKDTKPTPRADDGSNDDSIMAWGIALAVFHRRGEFEHDRRRRQQREFKKKPLRNLDPLDPRIRRQR